MQTSAGQGFELIMKAGVHPERVTGRKAPPPPRPFEEHVDGLRIERNVAVTLRDGVQILVDIHRPEGAAGQRDLPVILGWSPYGKHNTSERLVWPEAGVEPGWMSRHTAFEAPDPAYWCPRGFAIVYADPRGCWYSGGDQRHGGVGEAEDCFDLIEWLAARPWTNGRIGMSGVSYLTAIQWQVAPLRPPHLAAINPWEGFTDWYREFAYHGGIPETSFLVRGSANLQWSTTRSEDTAANARAHPLHDAYWRSKEIALEDIDVPAYVVASWADHGLHTRGTLEGFRRMGSRQKWLEVHGRKKWQYYYRPDRREKQYQFFTHFLKAHDVLVPAWPRVQVEVRERANVGELRAEQEWPLARTQYRPWYLDARGGDAQPGTLQDAPVAEAGMLRYASLADTGRAVFERRFDAAVELTGPAMLRLWVEAEGSDDMDLFVALQKLDAQGQVVPFIFYAMSEDGPVALGWLRVSHRELDAARSRPGQPVHRHEREQRLRPGECVPVDIEIWASSTRFAAGESLRLVVQGRDIVRPSVPNAPFALHADTRNQGTHVIRTGGRHDSHLLVPVVPAREVVAGS